MAQAFLINYDRCFGCHACEVACQVYKNLPPKQYGVKVALVGPWEYEEGKWQYDYVPTFTKQCDKCTDRVAEGKPPMCVQHCCGNALEFGEADQLAKKIGKREILQVF